MQSQSNNEQKSVENSELTFESQNKKSTNKRATVIILVVIIVLLLVSAVAYAWVGLKKKYSPQVAVPIAVTNVTPLPSSSVTPTPSNEVVMDNNTVFGLLNKQSGTKLYYSQKLGVGFTYLQDPSSPVTVTEIGDKIYIHGSKEKPEQGQSVEVFTKAPQLSLPEAISAKFLSGYNPEDCFVKIDEPNPIGLPNYIAAIISFPRSEDQNAPWWQNSKCPENYSETNGQQYFLMNKEVPDRFLFVKVGQYSIALDGTPMSGTSPVGQNWSHSIRILPISTSSLTTEQSINYDVVVKENPNNKTKTDVYLKDPKTAQETFYTTLSDLYTSHYHVGEYHNGNLYIIHRTGGDSGYQTNPNWTDELWRYNQQKQGQKLFSARGLDFRVSDDEKMIAIVTNDEFNLLNNSANIIKTFKGSDVTVISGSEPTVPSFNFLAWGVDSIWLTSTGGPYWAGLVRIDIPKYTIAKYDLLTLSLGSEHVLNVFKEKIAFSNLPQFFDVDSAQEYARSGKKVNLVVYDLKTKTRQLIANSITKGFDPKWTDENTLEYNNPDGMGRLKKLIP